MGALRRAGVWLGLVEDYEDRDPGGYDDDFGEHEGYAGARPGLGLRAPDRPTQRDPQRTERDLRGAGRDPRRTDLRGAERDRQATDRELPPSQRERRGGRGAGTRQDLGRGERGRTSESAQTDQAGVRSLATRSTTAGPGTVGPATRDNLALAPQVQLRERAVVGDEQARRYQITTVHPTSYSEARTIGEQFRDGVPVIMNLTEMAEADAKRLVDFAAGLTFGLRGTIERVTNRVFLLSPANVQVTAEDKARIAEGGFFDQSR